MRIVDLRSDTMNQPTREMRQAMAEAVVGDDVYGEDPTVTRLEALAAALMDKPAARFVPSGTMANLAVGLAYGEDANAIIVTGDSHIFHHEGKTLGAFGRLQVVAVPADRWGRMDPAELDAAVRTVTTDGTKVAAICIENTHNRKGGTVLTPEDVAAISKVAKGYGIPLYMDGARVLNAAVALNIPVRELVVDVETVSFCLSKCLGCPAGSLVCGDTETIARVQRYRNILGGGMRQVGVLAAAGIVGLERMVDRIQEYHSIARRLATGLANLDGIAVDPAGVQTNIVQFEVLDRSAADLVRSLKEHGVLVHHRDGQTVRMLTHPGIRAADVSPVLSAFDSIMRKPARPTAGNGTPQRVT